MNLQAENLAGCLLHGDYAGAWEMVEGFAESGHNSLFVYELLTQAMRQVGELWD